MPRSLILFAQEAWEDKDGLLIVLGVVVFVAVGAIYFG